MTNNLKLACALALGALLLSGCGKEEPARDPYDTPYARMHDPEYLKALDAKRDEQKEIMRAMVAARKEIAAFRAAHPGEETPPELQKKLTDAADRMERSRLEAQRLTRERIKRENSAIEGRKQRNLNKDK